MYIPTYLMIICPVSAFLPDIQESTRGLRLVKESSPFQDSKYSVNGLDHAWLMEHARKGFE